MENQEPKTTKEEKEQEEENAKNEADDRDKRSIFVGNVDYSTSTEELRAVFKECGPIERVTIPTDHFSGKPKGYAYIEFTEESSAIKAESVNEKVFKGRKLKVHPKRNNIPKFNKPRNTRSFMRRSYMLPRSRFSRFRPY
jgi:polyadenylate-binding protein 2